MTTILVVDDEPDILEEIIDALSDEGYSLFSAPRVDDAIAILSDHPEIKLIITDLKMPGKSGADLIRHVQEKFTVQLKFIVISGHGSESMEIKGIDLRKHVLLKKPLGIEDLLDAVESILAGH